VKKIILLFLSCFLAAHNILQAQNKQLRFEHFTTNNGLSQASVYSINQDARGFMWFGTWDGLNRFDGYTFKVFKPDVNDSNAIKGSRISTIIEEKNGNLWVGTYEALNQYDYTTNRFQHYYVNDNNNKPIKGRYYAFFIDDKNQLWFTYQKSNLASINLTTKKITTYPFAEGTLLDYVTGSYPRYGFYKPLKTIHTSGTDGLRIIDVENKKVNYYFSANAKNKTGTKKLMWVVFPDKENKVWLASQDGLVLLNTADNTSQLFTETRNGFPSEALTSIVQDQNGNLWCATDGNGLWVFNTKQKKFVQHFIKDLNNSESLSENTITSLFIDRQKNLWINADPQGMDKINPYYQQINHVRSGGNGTNVLSNVVWSITGVDSKNVLVCFNQSGLMKYNLTTGESEIIKLPKGFKESSVYHSITDNNNKIWMASDAGLFYSHDKLQTITQVNHRKYYYVYLFQHHQKILIGAEDGLVSLPLSLSATSPDTIAELNSSGISVIANGVNDLVCVATYQNELFFLKEEQNKYVVKEKLKFDFLIKSIWCNDSTFWFATNVGLVKYSIANKTQTIFNEKSGLANNFIYGLLKGNDNNLWMSTNRGISSFDITKQKFKNFGLAEGVQAWEFNSRSFFQSKDSTLFFGGVNGFNFFNPSKLTTVPFEPSVQILSIAVNNTPVELAKFLLTKNPLMLKSNEGDIAFEFAAIDFNRNNNINYIYRLRNSDNWINIGNSRTLRFADLKDGDYSFEVKAQYANNITSPHQLQINFTILPPYYKKWWFYVLIFGAFWFAVFAFYRYRLTQLVQMQNIRNNIARDLHDDIGSTLSSIGTYSEVAISKINKQQPDLAKEVLEKTAVASRNMIERMSDIVWSINTQNDDLESLVSRMKTFAAFSLNASSINYTFQTNIRNLEIEADVRKNIYLIFKEAINNMAKYSNCKNATIILTGNNSGCIMEIVDDGVGFDNNARERKLTFGGNGIKNMQTRAKEAGGKLSIQSMIDSGTKIKLVIKF
jgi:ligand-binding sensor domain-containing protein/two-component sensor histidine kinase